MSDDAERPTSSGRILGNSVECAKLKLQKQLVGQSVMRDAGIKVR
jgi:hypothetical protein